MGVKSPKITPLSINLIKINSLQLIEFNYIELPVS